MKELFILGNGVMARALAGALKNAFDITFVARSLNRLDDLSAQGFKLMEYKDFDPANKAVILAFKPYALKEVAKKLSANEAKFIISVLANTSLDDLKALKAKNYARIMPNIAAEYGASTTPFVLLNDEFRAEILEILKGFGEIFELKNEAQMNAAMAISGCAPAFLAIVAEALAGAGVYEGLEKSLSLELVRSLFKGFGTLLEKEHPALLKENVCSPAGVTIKGVKVLEQRALRAAFFEAVSASANNKN